MYIAGIRPIVGTGTFKGATSQQKNNKSSFKKPAVRKEHVSFRDYLDFYEITTRVITAS